MRIITIMIRILRRLYSKITFYPTRLRRFRYNFYKLVKLNKELNIYDDRRVEVLSFFNISKETSGRLLEQVKEAKQRNNKPVREVSDDELLKKYIDQTEKQAVSHMMRYTRYDKSTLLVHYFNRKYRKNDRGQIKVLDYGCGVADYALSFGIYGYHITLSDIEGGVVEFAKWRCRKRNLRYGFIPVNIDNLYPEFGQQDIIVAGEVLEHIRDPLRTVRTFHSALPSGGYLWVSGYPYRERKVSSGHLREAFEAREDVLKYLNDNFRKIPIPKGYLLQKS